jgi:hypothetical protein
MPWQRDMHQPDSYVLNLDLSKTDADTLLSDEVIKAILEPI